MTQAAQIQVKFKIKSVDARENRDWKERTKKTRVHFFLEGENVLDNLINRHNRPYNLYRELLPEVLKQAGLDPDQKAVWSQKAGCSCGCSPAFILQGDVGKTVYVTIEAEMGA